MPFKLALSFMGIWLLAAAIMWLPMPHPAPSPGSKARVFASAITTGVLLLGWSGVFVVTLVRYAFGVSPPAAHFFDPGELLGDERWQIFGHRYRGRRAGQAVEIFFFPGQGVRRPLLVIEMAAHARGVLDLTAALAAQVQSPRGFR